MKKQRITLVTIIVIIYSILQVSPIYAQDIQDSVLCIGYDSDLQPRGIGNTIFQYTDKIGLWVKIQNPPDVSYRVMWEDPSGTQFRNTQATIISKSGENWGIIFDTINIADSTAKNKLGVWTVYLYIDGEVEVEQEFQIINYNEFVNSIQDIQEQIENIATEKNDLEDQNDALETSLEALQSDYEELEIQIGTSSDYENLQENYDDLIDDYDALKARQGTTQTMLYGSIIIALIAIVLAIYYGVLNK